MKEGQQSSNAAFQVAVSDKEQSKLGIGGTAKSSDRQVYYYAERNPEGQTYIQALNANFLPAGEKNPVEIDTFLTRYNPEPLIYYNKVKPAMDDLSGKLDKAEAHLQNGRLDKAEKAYKKVLDTDSENIKAIFGLGITYLSASNTEDAGEIFNKIMSLELAFGPEHTHLFNEFGIKMRKAGMLDKAQEYYQKGIDLCMDDDHLHFNMARIHLELKDYDMAIQRLQKALSLNPDFLEAAKLIKFAEAAKQKSAQPA